MTDRTLALAIGLGLTAGLACSSKSATQPQVDCTTAAPTTLAVGEFAVVDPATTGGCLILPGAGPAGAEHLVVALSSNGQETQNGIQGGFTLNAAPPTPAPPPAPSARRGRVPGALSAARAFHDRLRAQERRLAQTPGVRPNLTPRAGRVPPVVGEQDTFKVCQTTACNAFVDVGATALYVGNKAAVFLDNTVPPGGYTQADIDSVGNLFDDHLYPIDTTAFGRESDIDGNGVVLVLLTNQVNALSSNCNTNGIILGYFFGLDLLSSPNSNNAEIFYGLVPNPGGGSCAISATQARAGLGPLFIHEFQHMISFNQHALVRGGLSEDTWLNEGLSHFAEELGGRQIPDQFCLNNDCLTQYAIGNFDNAFSYLVNVEDHYLVTPGSSTGTLEERGANWLFVRWLVDQFAADSVLGGSFTRALVGTNQLGFANVQNVTGTSFAQLVTQWQLANYAERVTGFTEPTGRMRYKTWDLLTNFTNCCGPYPLSPDISTTGTYSSSGTLRAGSGRHVRIIQNANAAAVELELTVSNSGPVAPRFGVVRLE